MPQKGSSFFFGISIILYLPAIIWWYMVLIQTQILPLSNAACTVMSKSFGTSENMCEYCLSVSIWVEQLDRMVQIHSSGLSVYNAVNCYQNILMRHGCYIWTKTHVLSTSLRVLSPNELQGVAIKKPDCFYYSFLATSMTKRRVGHWPVDFPLPSHKVSFTCIG